MGVETLQDPRHSVLEGVSIPYGKNSGNGRKLFPLYYYWNSMQPSPNYFGLLLNNNAMIICIIHCRYTVKELLQLEFYAEETGIRVDIVKRSTSVTDEVPADVIQLQLRVVDPKKRRLQQRENEAVQFDYNITTDNPNAVAQEMV